VDTGSGTVSVTCSGIGLLVSYSIAAGSGASGTASARYMVGSTASHLAYQLYTTSNYATVWSSTGAGGAPLTGGYLLSLGNNTSTLSFYGRIPAGQNVIPGTYMDTILVTATY